MRDLVQAEIHKQRTIGIIKLFSDSEGIWLIHPVVPFDVDLHMDMIDKIEYYIEQIEETAAILLDIDRLHTKGVLHYG